MTRTLSSIRWVPLAILMIAGLLLSSCQIPPNQVKTEADDFAYSAIEKKWDDKFGIQANYKMKDTAGAEPTVLPEQVIGADGVLTLPEAVRQATANSSDYQREKEKLYLKALDLKLVRHLYEPNFFGGGTAAYNQRTPNNDAKNPTSDSEFRYGASAGFDQLLATGGRISGQVGQAWVDILTGNMRSGVISLFSATLEQPLLRGADREVALAHLTQAEQDLLYQVRSFNHYRKTFVVSVVSQYYQVCRLEDTLRNADDNSSKFQTIFVKIQTLAEMGKASRVKVDEIQQEYLKAQHEQILARRQYQQALDQFKLTIDIPPTWNIRLDLTELETLHKNPVVELKFEEAEALRTAETLRLDLANLQDQVLDAERKVRVAADMTRPELNLVASTNRPNTPFRDNGRTRTVNSVSASLDLPLDRTVAKTEYRRAMVELEQQKRAADDATDSIQVQVCSDFRKLREAIDRCQVNGTALDLARKRLDNTLELISYNRASTRDILRAQQDYYSAQNEATSALVDYTVAMLEFYRDTGILSVRSDGMWQAVNDPNPVPELPSQAVQPSEPIQGS